MKLAITGATGFIGRHVCRVAASRAGVRVVGAARNLPDAARAIDGVRYVALDCADGADAFAALGEPDVLVHLAWGGLPNYRSLRHFEHELAVQYRFLSGLVRAGLPALTVAGTCYEYGMVSGELDETLMPRPANPYAHAKATLLAQLGFLKTYAPFALTWARLFYTFGEGQAETSLLPLLQAAVRRGDATFPMSAGEQLRDYLPVGTVAEMLVDLALTRADNGVVNVSSGTPVSVRALVERWIAENGWSIELALGHYPYPDWEPLAFWGSTAKRRALIG